MSGAADAPSAPSPIEIEVDGAKLYAEWRGERVDGSPVLVFLHDGLGSIQTLREFPAMLAADLGLACFAYDRWGYGRSGERGPFPDDFMADSTARLSKVLQAVGIQDYALVGHSDGGTIALLHAAQNPPGLRATVSLAAHVHIDRLAEAAVRRSAVISDDEVGKRMFQFHGKRAGDVIRSWGTSWQRAFDAGWDITPELAAIRGPLLAVQGAEDGYGLPRQIESIAASVAHAETLLLPDVGHFPHHEDAAATSRLVADFLHRHGL